MAFAVGFARPDRWRQSAGADEAAPWHAVEVHRPPSELDGEIELAVCGAIVQVWGRQDWERLSAGRTACTECQRLTTTPGTAVAAPPAPSTGEPAPPAEAAAPRQAKPADTRHLRVVS